MMIDLQKVTLFPTGFRASILRNKKPPDEPRKGHSDGYLVAGARLELATFGL